MNVALRAGEHVTEVVTASGASTSGASTGDERCERVRFDAVAGEYTELPGGISLYLGSVDLTDRSVSGWMWIAGDHRHVWLRDQHVNQPVAFRRSEDGQMVELMITAVDENAASGYLTTPGQTAQLH